MSSFPSRIFNVSPCPPRLIDPPTPPTLRQIEHTQSYSIINNLEAGLASELRSAHLIRNRSARDQAELDGTTVTATLEFNPHLRLCVLFLNVKGKVYMQVMFNLGTDVTKLHDGQIQFSRLQNDQISGKFESLFLSGRKAIQATAVRR